MTAITWKRRFQILSNAVDAFINVDMSVDDCGMCSYDPDSVTPIDGHEETCPIRKLADAYMQATS